jgi:glyoxylase-like metal-dependent hydrolase (beta-lactamase superfamily II)
MEEFDFLTHRKLGERLYLVQEKFGEHANHEFNIFVAVGDNKAAVFDSGMGVISGLRRYIETYITGGKPLCFYATHGDLDHFGGAYLFDEIYMNHRELPKLAWNLNLERRFSDLKVFTENDQESIAFCRQHYIHDEDLPVERIINIDDGDIIDIGGITFEVFKIPGHTPGALAYYNRAEKYVFTGDSALESSWQRCRDLQECLDCHVRLMEALPEDITIYSAHGKETQTMQTLRDFREAFEEILAGKTENDAPTRIIFEYMDPEELTYDPHIHHTGKVGLAYDANILKDKRQGAE